MKKILISLGTMGLIAPSTLGAINYSNQKNSANNITQVGENLINKNFLAYYRAWRDVEMEGVNTDLPDKNWITMNDIPYGINIVNIFSYVPPGQEAKAEPYFEKLKSEYGPALRSRGVKLIRGFDYGKLHSWWTNNHKYEKISLDNYQSSYPTPKEIEVYANQLFNELVNINGFQLDGLDIDMEQTPNDFEINISNAVIRELGKKIGPQSKNENTLFLYDTNGENVEPFQEVANYFDLLAYQQYGSDSTRTKNRVLPTYEKYINKNKIMPGLTFPEEKDNNRWYDTELPYETSHFYDVAKFVNDNDLGGMFVYALDRDGRNYDDDLTTIRESNMLWTKTAILETNGVSLITARQLAIHHLERIQDSISLSNSDLDKLKEKINAATNLLDINAVVMGYDYPDGISPTYDPILENEFFKQK